VGGEVFINFEACYLNLNLPQSTIMLMPWSLPLLCLLILCLSYNIFMWHLQH